MRITKLGRIARSVFIYFVLYIFCCDISLSAQSVARDNFNFIFENNFEDDRVGKYSESDFMADWRLSSAKSLLQNYNVDIVTSPDARYNKIMRAYFPKSTFGSTTQGTYWSTPLSGITELYFSYDIYFKPGFEWVLGGKIPGLTGGDITSGMMPGPEDGFSARMMWNENGKLVAYVYHQDQPIIYGGSYRWGSFSFTSGKWYNVTIRIVLNTNGANNGIYEGYIDGKLMFQKTDFKYRSLESIKIDKIVICQFFGGSTADWATLREEWIDTDNYVAYTYSNKAIDVPRGNVASSASQSLLHPYYDYRGINASSSSPDAPSGLTGTSLSSGAISLKWSDNSNNETGFSISRSLSPMDGFSEIKTLPVNSIMYEDNELQSGLTYYYKVRAFNGSNYSSFSQTIEVTTATSDPPAAPTNLVSLAQTTSSISLSWKDNSSKEKGFVLYRSDSESGSFKEIASCLANESSCTDKYLSAGLTYYYKLRAFNDFGFSDFTSILKVSTLSQEIKKEPVIYIDPDNTDDPYQDGSSVHPFDSWSDVTWIDGHSYLQRKGTIAKVSMIQVGANNVLLGSYGTGNDPQISSPSKSHVISGFEKSGIHIMNLSINAPDAVSCINFLGKSSDSIVIDHCSILTGGSAIKVMDAFALVVKYNRLRGEQEALVSNSGQNSVYYNIFEGFNSAINISGNNSAVEIFNNVFYNNHESLVTNLSDLTLYNNIFYLSGTDQKAMILSSSKITSDNNIYFPEQNNFITVDGIVYNNLDEIQRELKTDLRSYTTDPIFIDCDNLDFRLKSTSPAINSGREVELKADFEGKKIPLFNKVDIGAYEFNGIAKPLNQSSASESVIKVYPNPSRGPITVEVSFDGDLFKNEPVVNSKEISVMDIDGKTLISNTISTSSPYYEEQIDLTGLKNGLYIVIIRFGEIILKEKIIILK